jgi:hypothetical protein
MVGRRLENRSTRVGARRKSASWQNGHQDSAVAVRENET